jgi:hypothetical protein
MDSDLSYTARLREVVERCLLESHQQTPENTRRAYAPKQKEWKVKRSIHREEMNDPFRSVWSSPADERWLAVVSKEGLRAHS